MAGDGFENDEGIEVREGAPPYRRQIICSQIGLIDDAQFGERQHFGGHRVVARLQPHVRHVILRLR